MAKQIKTIADLKPDIKNANAGTPRGRGMVEASLREVGAGRSIVTDKEGRVIAGNKTLEAAADIGLEIQVVHSDGQKLFVVQRDDLDLSDDTGAARRLAFYDNRASETGLAWNAEQLLADINAGVSFDGIFNQDELDALLAGLVEEEPVVDPGPQIDKAEELRHKWGVELGQTWQIGNHTLHVGSIIDDLPVAQTIIVDPEWNDDAWIDIGRYANALVFFDNNHIADVITHYGAPRWVFTWDCGTTWFVSGKPLLQAKFCAWYGNGKYIQDGWRYGESSFKKGQHTNGRGAAFDYEPHEDGRILSDIFKRAIVAEHRDTDNNHSKPLDWVTALLANCTAGDVVDPFGGSGTTIIACEQLERTCQMADMLPSMAASIIERCHLAEIRPILLRAATQ